MIAQYQNPNQLIQLNEHNYSSIPISNFNKENLTNKIIIYRNKTKKSNYIYSNEQNKLITASINIIFSPIMSYIYV